MTVLFLSFAALNARATVFASGVAVAGPDRPAAVPEGYLITPSGYFHPSCVLRIEEGEKLLADGRVEHGDGTVETKAAVCAYPHYTPMGMLVTEDGRAGGAAVAAASETKQEETTQPIIRGWLESIYAITSTSYGEISATWTVPPQPSANDGQTVFFFPGFEDTNDWIAIVQPVLQWYAPGPWAVASWNCCLKGVVWESHPVKVSPGDTIVGTITSMCKKGLSYCPEWKIISEDATTGKKTTLRKTPAAGQVWNWGFGAVLEVYGIGQCSDFPANTSVEFTVQLYDQNRQLISSPGWIADPAAAGTSPDCNYGLNVTATQETVEY
jgi:hypothetical protein